MAQAGANNKATKPRDQSYAPMDRAIDLAVGGAIWIGRRVPSGLQSGLAHLLSRSAFAQHKSRAREHLAYIWPDMTLPERRTIAQASVQNIVQGTFEIADSNRLRARAALWEPTGPGLEALVAARSTGRAAILVTGHFGNWEAARAALAVRGHEIGGLYRPLNNGFLEDRWKSILSGLSGPVFARGRTGLRGLLRYLKDGGAAVILPDQFVRDGTMLDFLGQPAPTSLAAAELALRFDAPLIPFYGIRRAHDFEIVLEAPIAPTSPEEMMQSFNDSLAERIRATPDQWLWTHRRWKPGRHRNVPKSP